MKEDKVFLVTIFAISFFLIILGFYFWANEGLRWRVSGYDLPKELYNQINNSNQFHENNYGGSGYPSYGKFVTDDEVDIILLGDSHAKHYASGLDTHFEKKGISVFSIAGTSCFHLPNFTRTTPGIDWNTRCPEQLNKLFEVLKKYPEAIVVLSHSWEGQRDQAAILEQGKIVKKNIEIDDIVKAINVLKKKIGDTKLVVIGNVPGSGVDRGLLNKISRPRYLLYEESLQSVNYRESKRSSDRFAEKLNSRLVDEATKDKRYIFINPYDFLCSDVVCRNFDDQGRLIYSDSAHLSKMGSQYVIKQSKDQISLALSAR